MSTHSRKFSKQRRWAKLKKVGVTEFKKNLENLVTDNEPLLVVKTDIKTGEEEEIGVMLTVADYIHLVNRAEGAGLSFEKQKDLCEFSGCQLESIGRYEIITTSVPGSPSKTLKLCQVHLNHYANSFDTIVNKVST